MNNSKKTKNENENSHGTEAVVENSEDKGSVRKGNQTAGRKWKLDKTKGRHSGIPEGNSSVVSLTKKNDERLLLVDESFPLKKEKNADVKDGSRVHIRPPGQAVPVSSASLQYKYACKYRKIMRTWWSEVPIWKTFSATGLTNYPQYQLDRHQAP